MKISLRLLREGVPKELHEKYDPKDLDLEFVDLTYLEKVMLNGTAERFRDTLTVRGQLASRIERTCARCLKPVEESMDQSFELVYDVRGKEEVDTTDDLREMLILDHPLRFLCNENCPGLCPSCGANLNDGPCTCLRKV